MLAPHAYVPSATHQGDCAVCGHLQGAPIHLPRPTTDRNQTMTHKYPTGARVEYCPAFGTQPAVVVTIEGRGEKNDRPVYDLDNGHWAYESQIIRVID